MSSGRPRATSHDVIAEAACELFLERGFAQTTVADITRRAGVSRSSFFNYFGSKSDVLWGGFDARLDAAITALAQGAAPRAVLREAVDALTPDSLALAITNADAMGIADDLDVERAVRQARLARGIAARMRADGEPSLVAEVQAAALSGALFAAVWQWARSAPARQTLPATLADALAVLPAHGRVRQLRLVVRADDFDEALAFYRDVVGMPQSAAYEADGGARVAILEAGRATLELANLAQVAFIDGVETDGDAPSDPLRVALEVGDAAAVVDELADAGARVEASARITPWNSLGARLRGRAGLQLTIFQELER